MSRLTRNLKKSQKHRKKELSQLSSFWLLLLGSGSFLVAGYWGLLLGKVFPDYVVAANTQGFPPVAIALAVIFGVLGVGVWWYGTIAYRCNELLLERHFR